MAGEGGSRLATIRSRHHHAVRHGLHVGLGLLAAYLLAPRAHGAMVALVAPELLEDTLRPGDVLLVYTSGTTGDAKEIGRAHV